MSNGSVRAIGAASTPMDEEDSKLPRCPLERICDASRGIYKQARRRASEQVNATFHFSIFPYEIKIEGIRNKIPKQEYQNSNGMRKKICLIFGMQGGKIVGSNYKAGQPGGINEMGGPHSGRRG